MALTTKAHTLWTGNASAGTVSTMIVFAADNHYGTHAGAALYECIRDAYDIAFCEDDFSLLGDADLMGRCTLLMLNMIAGTCGVDPPGPEAETHVRAYVRRGGHLLLLHGSSAAFWHWDWWRPLVGHRWVRPDDPDGVPQSEHPTRPYRVNVAKCPHPLCALLKDMALPEDEIYMRLEQTCPATTLMETTTGEGTFVQCYETVTPAGGTVIGFLPGHRPHVVTCGVMLANVRVLIDYLLERAD